MWVKDMLGCIGKDSLNIYLVSIRQKIKKSRKIQNFCFALLQITQSISYTFVNFLQKQP